MDLIAATFLALSLGPADRIPWQFDHEPIRPYQVVEMGSLQLQQICGQYGAMACAWPHGDTIWIDGELLPVDRAETLRHEKAHINGWVHE